MFGWFTKRRSKDSLKERLKLVLSYDRAKLTPGKMEELKVELLGVIGKYFPSEAADYDVRFEQQGDRMVLLANLPIKDEKGAGQSAAEGPARKPTSKGQPPQGRPPKR